jgi:HNH endonuclease
MARALEAGDQGERADWNWSAGKRKYFPLGSTFFLVRTGKPPLGIVGRGTIPDGRVYEKPHWDQEKDDRDERCNYVDIVFERLIEDPEVQPERVLDRQTMAQAGLRRGIWNPQIGGIGLSADERLELLSLFDARQPGSDVGEIKELLAIDCALDPEQLAKREGRRLIQQHLVRERNQALSKKKKESVLRATGRLACEACGFDLFAFYGEHFAECHHKRPLAELTGSTKTTLQDLQIVCANCHRILHRKWIKILELQKLIRERLSADDD